MLTSVPISHLPGQVIPDRPLWMKGSICTNYLCTGNSEELSSLCETWFNGPLKHHGDSMRISPYSDVVLISFIKHPWAYQLNDKGEPVAYYSFKELKYSFMVEASQGSQEVGTYMFVPIKFVSLSTPMAWERQVYGIPAVKARISEEIDGHKVNIQCDAFGIENFGPESRAKVLKMIDGSTAPIMLGAIGNAEADQAKIIEELEQMLDGRAPKGMAARLVPFQQNDFVALREFLSTSNPNDAVFQDILTYKMGNLKMEAFSWLGDSFHLNVPETTGTFEIVSKLLDQKSLDRVCAWQYIYNFELAPGKILWRA